MSRTPRPGRRAAQAASSRPEAVGWGGRVSGEVWPDLSRRHVRVLLNERVGVRRDLVVRAGAHPVGHRVGMVGRQVPKPAGRLPVAPRPWFRKGKQMRASCDAAVGGASAWAEGDVAAVSSCSCACTFSSCTFAILKMWPVRTRSAIASGWSGARWRKRQPAPKLQTPRLRKGKQMRVPSAAGEWGEEGPDDDGWPDDVATGSGAAAAEAVCAEPPWLLLLLLGAGASAASAGPSGDGAACASSGASASPSSIKAGACCSPGRLTARRSCGRTLGRTRRIFICGLTPPLSSTSPLLPSFTILTTCTSKAVRHPIHLCMTPRAGAAHELRQAAH